MPFLLLATFRGLVDQLHERLAERGFPGVTATQGFSMQAIGSGCSGVELASRLGVSKQAAAKTLQSLEAAGFVQRTVSAADARRQHITPTARGTSMLVESGRIFTDLMAALRARVGDHDVDVTINTLARADHGARAHTDLSDWA